MNIILILASVLLNCIAQLFIRKGMLIVGDTSIGNFMDNIVPMVTNLWLWGAMLCYGVSILLWMSVLSKVEVSFAYPFLSVGYILTTIAGYFFFGENVSFSRIIGVIIICIGVFFISRS